MERVWKSLPSSRASKDAMKVVGIGGDGRDEWTEAEYKAAWPGGR